VEGVVFGGGIVRGDEGGGAEGTEGSVEGEVVDVGGETGGKCCWGDFCAVAVDMVVLL